MNLVLWIVAGVLAALFLVGGVVKLALPPAKLADFGMGFADDIGAGTVKVIGALEVLASVGLIVPAALDVAPVLVPLAALGLVLLMIGAILTHLRRQELPPIMVNVLLLVLAAFVAFDRFDPTPFA